VTSLAILEASKMLCYLHEIDTIYISQIPSAGNGWIAEGMTVSITDCPINLIGNWGTNVTTGGGSYHAMIRWNGSNWTVAGA
jgi:hypothetical protein